MDPQEQLELLYEIFDPSMPRLGPGDDAATSRALEALLPKSTRDILAGRDFRVLDIGCGNGASTVQLAKLLPGEIVALDSHQPYLNELQRRAETEGVSIRIRPWLKDMLELRPSQRLFDLIWSEGALYCLGVREGLTLCRSLLTPGGSMAFSELCWLQPDPPAECARFFADEYPAMTDVDTNLGFIRDCGFDLVGRFTLPESSWLETYYGPMETRLGAARERYAADPERTQMIDRLQMEIDMYRRFSDYYGYVFFLMRR